MGSSSSAISLAHDLGFLRLVICQTGVYWWSTVFGNFDTKAELFRQIQHLPTYIKTTITPHEATTFEIMVSRDMEIMIGSFYEFFRLL